MPLVGYGVVTLAFMVALFRVSRKWQYTWLVRGFLVYSAWSFGVTVDGIVSGLTDVVTAIPV